MRPSHVFFLILLLLPIASLRPESLSSPPAEGSVPAASPEMDRLANGLVGDWDTVEMMERGPSFPEGGSRKGHVHVRLASGGYTLTYEGHSDGSAGKLDGFLTIWWDKNTKLYYFLACFNNPNGPCRMRGTAHWEGDSFVNDYDSVVNGNKTQWRDTFTFTPTSHTLVAAMDSGSGAMKPVITTTATRPQPEHRSRVDSACRSTRPGNSGSRSACWSPQRSIALSADSFRICRRIWSRSKAGKQVPSNIQSCAD